MADGYGFVCSSAGTLHLEGCLGILGSAGFHWSSARSHRVVQASFCFVLLFPWLILAKSYDHSTLAEVRDVCPTQNTLGRHIA